MIAKRAIFSLESIIIQSAKEILKLAVLRDCTINKSAAEFHVLCIKSGFAAQLANWLFEAKKRQFWRATRRRLEG